jgi:hypothetical protein
MNLVAISPDALNRFRQAASQLTQAASSRASRLLTLKDEIAALRKQGVSYRAISELLTQNGIPTSDVGVLKFCRRFLNEGSSRKSSARRRALHQANRPASPKSAPETPAKTTLPPTPAAISQTPPASNELNPYRTHGPHIAKLIFRKPADKT